MDVMISGTVAQTAGFSLQRGDSLWASKGSIISHTTELEWNVRVPGGLAAGLKRSLSGEGISLTHVEAKADDQVLTLGANSPGHIAEWDLATEGPVLTTRGAFLAAWGTSINITVSVTRKAGAALFGGAGFVLQRIEGNGTVLVHGRGDFHRVVLGQAEEVLVSTGNLAAFADAVDYDIMRVGSLRKSLFGKEGLFMTRLGGPGTILLQTLKSGSAAQSQR